MAGEGHSIVHLQLQQHTLLQVEHEAAGCKVNVKLVSQPICNMTVGLQGIVFDRLMCS